MHVFIMYACFLFLILCSYKFASHQGDIEASRNQCVNPVEGLPLEAEECVHLSRTASHVAMQGTSPSVMLVRADSACAGE